MLYRRALITKTPDRVRLGKHMFRVQAVSVESLLLLGAKENRTLQGKVDKMKFLARQMKTFFFVIVLPRNTKSQIETCRLQ